MIYFRCKCRLVMLTYAPPVCFSCAACNSGVATSPEYVFSYEPQPHEFDFAAAKLSPVEVEPRCAHCDLTAQEIAFALQSARLARQT